MAGPIQLLMSYKQGSSPVVNSANFNLVANTSVGNGDYGLKVTANNTTNITVVTKTSSTAATKARIANSSYTVLGTATFSGNDATFSGSGVAITSGQTYYVLINAEGSNFNSDYGTVATDLPSVGTDLTFVGGGSTNNAVYLTPYNVVLGTLLTNGPNQLGIVSVTTQA